VSDLARQDEFLFEAAENFGMAGEVGSDEFQRDQTVELQVASLVDGSHATLAEELKYLETVAEDGSRLELPLGSGFTGGARSDGDGPSFGAADYGRRNSDIGDRQGGAAFPTAVSGGRVVGLTERALHGA
jgi:hypothetical protein